jgi:hypothetical protein
MWLRFIADCVFILSFVVAVDPPNGLSGVWLAIVRGACIGIIMAILDGKYERKAA